MALPTGGYSYTPQTANLGASPLSALKPLDVGVSVSFTPMPKYEVPSAQEELVSMGAAKGFQALTEPVFAAIKEKADEKKAAELLKGKYAHEEKIAGIRAAKTARELLMEDLRYKDLENRVNERGGNKGEETINYGSFEDETPIGDSDLPTNQEADVSNQPSLFNITELENPNLLGQINPTPERVAALWNTPLAQLTASAGTAGAQQEQALASMGAGTLTPAGQVMSTDAQPQATAPAPEEPRFGLMSKFRGLYTPEEAKKMRAEFSGKMEEFSGDGKMEPVPSGLGYQFDKPMRDVAPVRVEKAIPVTQASQATAKPTKSDIGRYIQAWADPSVASSAADKVAEIMGSEYAYPEITQFKNKNGDVGYRVNIPKRLSGKELAELKAGKKEKLQQFQLQSFENVNRAQATLSDLAKQLEKVQSKMGPISGNLLKRNPYDEDVQLLQNYMTALIPTIARGVYGEVGVLTQADIDNYSKLIPNITQSPSLAKSTLEFLSKDIERAKNNKFDIWESTNYDVEGLRKFVKTKPSNEENLSDQAAALAKLLSTLPKGSPEEAKARQDLIVIRGKIVEANNAGK